MGKKIEILVSPQGVARHLYSEEAAAITAKLGPQDIRRASHVEPTYELSCAAVKWLYLDGPLANQPCDLRDEHRLRRETTDSGLTWELRRQIPQAMRDKWWADLLISGGPVLGPFEDRQAALAAEAAWLHEHHIPVCPTGDCSKAHETQPQEPQPPREESVPPT